ncbi:alpha/beta fold hydrolase [Microbacterium gorillae]|uniref:alpha/beta fold hydrolase n=1 Tax=Microbacterium gorillae TaxID=1231063 RepID=UPI00058D6F0D|nr:alpha/beta hydrolase [Microbacterium gorillae]
MDIILIAGLWLPHTVWARTAAALNRRGHRATTVRLPGADDDARRVRLDDQLSAVITAVDAADRPLVVGHSAAATLAWLAADRRAESVAGVVLIGGMPRSDGESYAAFFPVHEDGMHFPGWEPFAGPDTADLSPQELDDLAISVRPVSRGVALGAVRYTDAARRTVPVTVICPEFSVHDGEEWIASGEVPELSAATSVDLIDIDTGHWPMISSPDQLAEAIDEVGASLLAGV